MPRADPQPPVTSKYFLPPKVNLEQPHVGGDGGGCENGNGGGDGEDGEGDGASGGAGADGGDGGVDTSCDHDHAKLLIVMLCPPPPPTTYLNVRSFTPAASSIVSDSKTLRVCGARFGVLYTITPSPPAKSATWPFWLPHPWSFHSIENVKEPRTVGRALLSGHQDFQESEVVESCTSLHVPAVVGRVGGEGGEGGEGGGDGGDGGDGGIGDWRQTPSDW